MILFLLSLLFLFLPMVLLPSYSRREAAFVEAALQRHPAVAEAVEEVRDRMEPFSTKMGCIRWEIDILEREKQKLTGEIAERE